jgi:hypothetical protein
VVVAILGFGANANAQLLLLLLNMVAADAIINQKYVIVNKFDIGKSDGGGRR